MKMTQFFQDGPELENQYDSDSVLRGYLKRFLPSAILAEIEPDLRNIGASKILYRKLLKPFQKFELQTKVAGWDEKWIYFDQRFEWKGTTYAKGFIQALFMGPDGKVPVKEVLDVLKWRGRLPRLAPDVEECRRKS